MKNKRQIINKLKEIITALEMGEGNFCNKKEDIRIGDKVEFKGAIGEIKDIFKNNNSCKYFITIEEGRYFYYENYLLEREDFKIIDENNSGFIWDEGNDRLGIIAGGTDGIRSCKEDEDNIIEIEYKEYRRLKEIEEIYEEIIKDEVNLLDSEIVFTDKEMEFFKRCLNYCYHRATKHDTPMSKFYKEIQKLRKKLNIIK